MTGKQCYVMAIVLTLSAQHQCFWNLGAISACGEKQAKKPNPNKTKPKATKQELSLLLEK